MNVLCLGTGEYTTGWVGKAADSDKSTGVVGLVMLDLRKRGKVGRIGICGTNGTKLPAIRRHLQRVIGDVYEGLDPSCMETYPADDVVDRKAYLQALTHFKAGDCAIIFTPDDTHFDIASACLERGLHVMITKPPVKTLKEHSVLAAKAKAKGCVCVVEVHKRFDPIYKDAKDRIHRGDLGDFSFFQSYMSQPKHQLETFKAWAGKSSDISYYLNSHHVDFHEWAVRTFARPERVTAFASTGVATKKLDGVDTEDAITLAVEWRNLKTNTKGHALHTSSWIAAKGDVHSQQRFFYVGTSGEITVDQAHRGYTVTTDENGYTSSNPLFWKPAPSADGRFAGQHCYGYLSFEHFIDAAAAVNQGTPLADIGDLPTIATTAGATAVLEAGRISLDNNSTPVDLLYDHPTASTPVDLKLATSSSSSSSS
eukprot:CAMPEP_0118908554 /NCGR_PEP_ID=MMETSP1166-20130328/11510_1 /TAXON_ID=1104430 /ORGANISM="Chrysoreinhardia sp, Strain CCMP3193" /LENGTH=424 /DNA_ID=CAMNT_0006847949 /DNA_START=13 /DNA_END=1287 /DNA_ORIENTATION=-